MTIVLTFIHIVVSLFLILVVLAQQGKGQDLASAFGGGGSSTAFGARGTATLLSKVTTVAAIVFMLTSLGLSYFKPAMSGGTVVPSTPTPQTQPQEPGTEEGQPGVEGQTPTGEEAQPGAVESPAGEQPGSTTTAPEPEGKGEQTPPPPEKKQ